MDNGTVIGFYNLKFENFVTKSSVLQLDYEDISFFKLSDTAENRIPVPGKNDLILFVWQG
ncbi:hypothetical protein BpJC7_31400 [Weizmannia acidilactici]|uniref:Uncharacterized protein n=1 Tax=Weizmannia acidilactici TaxID=2607726 RepID=A0A5J4JN81_9BACI|nr:hypothetical protein BpJC7_31400 [Weizmannia acidilactici]